MAIYPGSDSERRILFDELHRTVSGIFSHCGMSNDDAAVLAHSLAWADLRGIHSHGVLRVPEYVHKLTGGGVDPAGRPHLVKDHRAIFIVDAANSMGAIACNFAMEHAIHRAREYGIAFGAIRGSNHCGALSVYAVQALHRGMIGLAATNALPTMAPWGGKDKIAGINPLAAAIPTGVEAPIVLDCAFSYSSHGKIRVFYQKGADIPPTWAFDVHGRPTTDPAEAIAGLLQPIGEYKGVGLAIVMGILSSLLSGAAYGTELGNMVEGPRPGLDGHFVVAIDVEAFTSIDEFKQRADSVVRQIRVSTPIDPGVPLYAPGGLEHQLEAIHRTQGIPLNQATLDGIAQAAARVNASCEWRT